MAVGGKNSLENFQQCHKLCKFWTYVALLVRTKRKANAEQQHWLHLYKTWDWKPPLLLYKDDKETRWALHLILQMRAQALCINLQTPVIYNCNFIVWCIQVIIAAKFINPGENRGQSHKYTSTDALPLLQIEVDKQLTLDSGIPCSTNSTIRKWDSSAIIPLVALFSFKSQMWPPNYWY